MNSNQPVGIFDSGVGGLTILRAIRKLLPQELLIYLADTAHAPYGEKPLGFVAQRACVIADYFVTRGVKALVVACNTATAAAVSLLRQRYPRLIVIGVEPAIKPAAHLSRSAVIGVFATRGTLASPTFENLLRRTALEVRILLKPCPDWVQWVENGRLTGPQVYAAVAAPVHHLLEQYADVLVLGCTHFPFLRPIIQACAGPDVPVLETGAPVAQWLNCQLETQGGLRTHAGGGCEILTSGDPARFSAVASRLLEAPILACRLPPESC